MSINNWYAAQKQICIVGDPIFVDIATRGISNENNVKICHPTATSFNLIDHINSTDHKKPVLVIDFGINDITCNMNTLKKTFNVANKINNTKEVIR